MNRSQALPAPWYRRWSQRMVVAALILSCLSFTPTTALAAKKKKEEAPPTKSYVLPYMIVMMMVGVGLMTVCRPGKRLERADGKKVEEGE